MWIVVPSTCSPCALAGEGLTLGSEAQYQLLAQYVTWRGKPSPSRFWRRVCKTNSWMQHLSGQMLPRLTASRGVESWIASLAAIHASPSAPPVNGLVKTTPATCGPTSDDPSGKSNRSIASSRTSEDTSPSASSRCGETFADLVTRLKLDYSRRRKSVLRTCGNGSTFLPEGVKWPTPGTVDAGGGSWKNGNGNAKQWGGNNSVKSLVTAVDQGRWPTPRASANENRSTKPTPSQEKGKHGKYLASEVHRRWGGPTAQCVDMDTLERNNYSRDALKEMKDAGTPYQTQTTGMLNPSFVENLMGLPFGWTDISGPPDLERFSSLGSRSVSQETALTEQIA